ncbi:L-lactate MFS transporter [Cohaesibacter celericrescens]|uniref:Major facilitator superfamily (MFS) profile domain-containing protein n=1 Tax=Cohaesibacter celericrescens TaxID=2067669 RepID=A0A2N5XRH0_9HYPH|nr:OFA family MFS transporter [Cohaesibacter celericrescens]PLW77113.1 hypothetical protein C0081_11205 [Cohaesibacter celericrescens]
MDFNQKRWVYLGLSLVVAICSGIGYTWSVFQGPLIERFGWDLTTASLIFTAQIAVSTLTPMVIGRYQARLGTRGYLFIGALIYGLGLLLTGFTTSFLMFFIIFGLGVGVGVGMLYPCLMGYGVRIFPEKKGLAAGLLAGSYGAGAILWAPIAASLENLYDIMTVYKIFGICFTIIIALFVLVLRDPDEEFIAKTASAMSKAKGGTAEDKNWPEMVRSWKFYLLLSLFALGTTSGLMVMGHASSILMENVGVTATKAAFLVGMISIFNAVGRVFWGVISDSLGRFRILVVLFLVVGLSMVTLFSAQGTLFVVAIMAVGFVYGGFAALIAPAAADVFGTKYVNVNYGFLYIAYGIGGVLGPQIAAFTKNLSGGYSLGFLIVSAFSVIGIGLTFMIFRPTKAVIEQTA